MEYYFANDDQQKGPFARDVLRGAGMKRESLVWREGMSAWARADSVDELRDLFATAAPAAGDLGTPPDLWPQAPTAGAAPAPESYTPVPQYTPAPAPYGTPSYGTPGSAGPAAGDYAGAGQQLAYGGYPPAGAMLPTGMAMASMILGIIAIPMTCLDGIGVPVAIVGIVLGHVARGRIRQGVAGGSGMALAGLICGYVSLGLALIFIVALVFFFAVGATHHR